MLMILGRLKVHASSLAKRDASSKFSSSESSRFAARETSSNSGVEVSLNTSQGSKFMKRRLFFASRFLFYLIMSLGVCNFLTTTVAAAYAVRTGDSCEMAAQVWTDTEDGSKLSETYDNAANSEFDQCYKAISAQNLCEVAAVLLICLSFFYVVPVSLAVLRRAQITLQGKIRLIGSMQANDTDLQNVNMKNLNAFSSPEHMARHMVRQSLQASISQRRRLLVTNSIVLLTFIPRCVFVVFVAVSNFNNKFNTDCALCDSCQTIGRVLTEYLFVTPESYLGVSCLSSALPLAVGLWGMLSGNDRQLLRTNVVAKEKSLEGGVAMVNQHMHIALPT